MRTILFPIAALATLGACATTGDDGGVQAREPAGECDASGVQDRIGQRATADLGAELLEATGSTRLRWSPPRTPMTMDYLPFRLTVGYDDDMIIERIICG